MLPLSLLRTAQNHPMLVELKNGETYNGHLVSCDNWMNINLREVICTSRISLLANVTKALYDCPVRPRAEYLLPVFSKRGMVAFDPLFVKDGDKFWRMPECYIRGSTIKYLRIPDEVIDMVKEDVQMKSRGRGEMKGRGGQNQRGGRGGGRGTFGGRGGRGPAPLGRGGGNQGGNKMQNKPRPK